MIDPKDFIGKQVTVKMACDTWEGKAVAYYDRPAVLIEKADGFRIMLPAAFVELKENEDDN